MLRELLLVGVTHGQSSDHVFSDGGDARGLGTRQHQTSRTVVADRLGDVTRPARSAIQVAARSRDYSAIRGVRTVSERLEADSASDWTIGGDASDDRAREEAELVSDSELVVEPVVEELAEIPVEVSEQDDRRGSRLGQSRGNPSDGVLLSLPYLRFVEDRIAGFCVAASFL